MTHNNFPIGSEFIEQATLQELLKEVLQVEAHDN